MELLTDRITTNLNKGVIVSEKPEDEIIPSEGEFVREHEEPEDGVDQTFLYLASAFGIEYEDRIGFEVIWGENGRQSNDTLVLEGRVATFKFCAFGKDKKPEHLFVKPNIGTIFADRIGEDFFFPMILKYGYSEVMWRCIGGKNQPRTYEDQAGKLVSHPEKHFRYLLGSKSKSLPSILFPKKDITLLYQLAWEHGGTLNKTDGSYVLSIIHNMYSKLLEQGHSGFRLIDRGPERFNDYQVIDVRRCMHYGRFDIRPQAYDIEPDGIKVPDSELVGDLDEFVRRCECLDNSKVSVKGDIVSVHYTAKLKDEKHCEGFSYLPNPILMVKRTDEGFKVISRVSIDNERGSDKGYSKFIRHMSELMYMFNI